MNKIIDSLYHRKSVRVFEPTPIAPDIKDILLDCAAQAPTAGNQMMYTIIDVTDETLKAKLSVLCDNQPFISTAPIVLVFLADTRRWYNSYLVAGAQPRDPSAGDLMLAFADACIAAQNIVVAAESLGLGSCYIGDILENKEEVQGLLALPPNCMPACMLVIGYPTKAQRVRPKPARFDRRTYVHENCYKEYGYSELVELYNDRCSRSHIRAVKPFDEYMREFCNRKYNSEFSIEMNRSATAYVKEYLGLDEDE